MDPRATLRELVMMALGGLSTALGVLVLRGISELGKKVDDIGRRVQEHGESLSEGRRRFEEHDRRIGAMEHELHRILTEGCARAGAALPE